MRNTLLGNRKETTKVSSWLSCPVLLWGIFVFVSPQQRLPLTGPPEMVRRADMFLKSQWTILIPIFRIWPVTLEESLRPPMAARVGLISMLTLGLRKSSSIQRTIPPYTWWVGISPKARMQAPIGRFSIPSSLAGMARGPWSWIPELEYPLCHHCHQGGHDGGLLRDQEHQWGHQLESVKLESVKLETVRSGDRSDQQQNSVCQHDGRSDAKSIDGGVTWNPPGAGLDTVNLGTVVINPKTPALFM